MREAIGQVLPLAIAAAISPFPIVGVVLMLVTPRGRVNGPAFIVGWIIGLAVVGLIGLSAASAAGAGDNGTASEGANTVQILLGAALIGFAIRQWRKRPKPGGEPATPGWMESVDGFSPSKAIGLGFVLAAVNPKNLILALSAATTIAGTSLSGADQAIAYTMFAMIATFGVAMPVVISLTMGSRAGPILEDLKVWLVHHNATIMSVIFLVIGAKVLGQGIAG